MRKIRIGNDISVTWAISQEGSPYNLEGKDVRLFLLAPFGKKEQTDFAIKGNVVEWSFYGKNQTSTGKYSLELAVNKDKKGMVTTDVCDFVQLVACSCAMGGADDNGVATENITLESQIALAGANYDDTELRNQIAALEDGKQDNIADLEQIRTGASKGATALQSIPAEYVTETELNIKVAGKQDALVSGSNIKTINGESVLGEGNIVIKGGTDVDTSKFATKEEVNAKQDIISDLATIRSNALKGATALQSVPSEYVTESELSAKGYATTSQVNAKQDKINDLADIRTGAAKGATAIQEVKTINGQSIIGEGNIEIEAYNDAEIKAQIANKQDILISNINIKTINGESVLGSGNIIVGADTTNLATKTELNGVSEAVAGKQDVLVSGTNVKTINGHSIVGSGNLDVSVIVDTAFSETSENPLQNKVITPVLAAKADVTYVDSAIAAAITNVLNTEV